MRAAASRIRWGILGTDNSAQHFALGLAYVDEARLVAVGAHSQIAANVFGERNWIPRQHGSFAALADDPDIDVVYIATPPSSHRSHVRMCLQAGKAVVCDLPLATCTDEAAELIALARELGVAERVRFERVPRDRLGEVFAEDDVLLFPVRWAEPWGLVPLEAMAVGMQVVASGRGGSGEYLDDGVNSLLVDPDAGPQALADALTRLAHDEPLRRRIRAGALATAERFPDDLFADGVERAAEAAVRGR